MTKISDMEEVQKTEMPSHSEREKPVHKTLRLAKVSDIPDMMKLGQDLFKDSPLEIFNLDPKKIRQNLEAAILDPETWLVLISYEGSRVVGCLVAYHFQPLYSNKRIAAEVLWHLLPEFRKGRRGLDMMDAFEYWARLQGADVCQYGWLASSPAKMEELYEKRGLKLVEKVYFKEL